MKTETRVREAADPSRGSVLVVDDEPLIRGILVRWLTSAGYRCAEAGDAASALTHCQRHQVDLATLDVNMPGCSGLDLLAQLISRWPEMAVLMITAHQDVATAVEAMTRGAFGYLTKPVDRRELLLQVERGMERRHLLLERRRYTEQLERTVRRQTLEIQRAHEETIHRLLGASMYRDEETGAHIRRTGLASELLARAAGWPTPQSEQIRMAAPMHDIGKIGIPDAILRKPGKLTAQEFETMKAHTRIGAAILAGSRSPMLQMARQIALCHHEQWDGRGHPRGLRGPDIPESARIVALIDVYDALTHDRVYRPALSQAKAVEIIRSGRGTHFEPRLVDLFFQVLPEIEAIATAHPDWPDSPVEQPAEVGMEAVLDPG